MRNRISIAAGMLALALPAPAFADTLEQQLESAPRGATVMVGGGSYPHVTLTRADLTLRARPGENVTLGGLTVAGGSGLRIEGFRITGGVSILTGSSGVTLAGNDISPRGVYVGQVRGVRIVRNRIHDLRQEERAIALDGSNAGRGRGGARNIRISRNRILRTTGSGISVFWGARRILIERNEIAHTRFLGEPHEHTDAIHLAGLDDDQRRITIRRNHVHDNFYGLLVKQDGSGTIRGLRIERNVFEHTEARHLDLSFGVRRARVTGNTFSDSRWGVHVGDGASAVFQGNLIDSLELGPDAKVFGQRG